MSTHQAPVAPRKSHLVTFPHGAVINDEFYWLRDESRCNPEVLSYIHAENEFLEHAFAHSSMGAYRGWISSELKRRKALTKTQSCAPFLHLDYHYIKVDSTISSEKWGLTRWKADPACPRDFGRRLAESEQLVVSPDAPFLLEAPGMFEISPCQRYIAIGHDTNGDELFQLWIFDIDTQKLLEQQPLRGICAGEGDPYFSIRWSTDSKYLFYLSGQPSQPALPKRLYRHVIGTRQDEDTLLHDEPEEAFVLSLHHSSSRDYLFLSIKSMNTTQILYLPLATPLAKLLSLFTPAQEVEYFVDHRADQFYIASNALGHCNFSVLRAEASLLSKGPFDVISFLEVFNSNIEPSKKAWPHGMQMLIPQRPQIAVLAIETFANHLVIHEMGECQKRMLVIDFMALEPHLQALHIPLLPQEALIKCSHYVTFPDAVYSFLPGNTEDNHACPYRYQSHCNFRGEILTYTYTTFIFPKSVIDYNMRTREAIVTHQEIHPWFDTTQYVSERVWAKSRDGALVPISLVYRKQRLELDLSSGSLIPSALSSPRPVLLKVYGAYGGSQDPIFSPPTILLLDLGFVYAIAHVRGGSELGRTWYDDGKLFRKLNSIFDTIAAAEHLIATGHTTSQQLALVGRSAGGLVVGAIAHMRPDLFRSLIFSVPFVDCLVGMADASITWAAFEWAEWGNTNLKPDFEYIQKYCPITNILKPSATPRPHMFVMGGWNDPRVGYWEAAKFVASARLTAASSSSSSSSSSRMILLHTDMSAGHFRDYHQDVGYMWSFLLTTLCDKGGIGVDG